MNINDEIIKRIKRHYSARDICADLNMSVEELYNRIEMLKKSNIYYYSKVRTDGLIMFDSYKEPKEADTELSFLNGEYSVLALSDPHVGSLFDSIDRFKSLEDFAGENDIKLSICCGDLVDGPVHDNQSVDRRLPDLESQLDEFINYYPFFDFVNVCILGDHDTDYRTLDGLTVYKILKEYRPDIKLYGNKTGIIRINNKEILICHNIKEVLRSEIADDRIILSGHSHIYYNHTTYGSYGPAIQIVIPSMSNLPLHNGRTPGFLKLTFTFSQGELVGLLVDNYTFESDTPHILHNGNVAYQFSVKHNENSKGNSRKRK